MVIISLFNRKNMLDNQCHFLKFFFGGFVRGTAIV